MSSNVAVDFSSPVSHDEAARQAFVLDLKRQLRHRHKPRTKDIFEQRVLPAIIAEVGQAPRDLAEVEAVMDSHPYWRMWCALNRTGQDLMWEATCTPVVRDMPRLRQVCAQLAADRPAGGSLELQPGFQQPIDVTTNNIHGQPGGYDVDLGDDDVTAGAFYEAGGALYSASTGTTAPPRHRMGKAISEWLREQFPDFRPARIIEFGCSAGASTTAWPVTYPSAEMHAVDVGASLLRFAHARAEALGVPVHFHQRNCTETGFADGSFDLVVSHNLMHEISRDTLHAMARESWRLLAPGGIAIHQDVPLQFKTKAPIDQFLANYDTRYNDEPWWLGYATADVPAALIGAGFDPGLVAEHNLAKAFGAMSSYYLVVARKPA